MKDDILTRPLPAGPDRFIGSEEADVRPFEPAGIDWGSANRRRRSDPTYGQAQVPDAVVNSCSECCMETINGRPNLLRLLHRSMVKSCSQCPVGRAGDRLQARDGQGNKLYAKDPDGTVRPLTQTELMLMETDGTA